MRNKLWVAALFTGLVLVQLVSATIAKPRDTIRVGLRYDPATVNMLELKLASDIPVLMPMHQSLMGPHPETGQWANLLAESIEIVGGKDLKIRMIKGAKFHDGTPVTAHDVKWTYEQCADPKNANIMAGPLDEIEKIEVIDDHNLIIRFWEPYAPWRELMWIGICSKKYFDKVGPQVFRKQPMGSGPFRFIERKIGESVTLEAVKGYPLVQIAAYQERPIEYKRLKFVTVPNDVTRLAMLETGELDLVYEVLPHQLRRLKRNKKVKIKISDEVPSLVGISASPMTDPIMADRNLGLAIRHAINREEIVKKIFLGQGYPLFQFASRAELGYDPGVKYEFNPEKARAYLKKSAYKPGKVLIITYTSLVPNSALVAAIIQKYLKAVGITSKLQRLEEGVAATYVRRRDPRLGHLRLYAWAGSRDPNIRFMLAVLSTSPYTTQPNRPKKKEMDKLIKGQAREMDVAKRKAMIARIHQIMAEDSVGTFLLGLNMIYAMRSDIDYTWVPNEASPVHLQRIKVAR